MYWSVESQTTLHTIWPILRNHFRIKTHTSFGATKPRNALYVGIICIAQGDSYAIAAIESGHDIVET